MQAAVDEAFPQALGIFERLEGEGELTNAGVFPGNAQLKDLWLNRVIPVLNVATLATPVGHQNGSYSVNVNPEEGGRKKSHTRHLQQLVDDLQQVYRLAPTAKW